MAFEFHLGPLHIRVSTTGIDCCSKIDYRRRETALRAAAEMNRKPTTRRVLEAYQCSVCGGWHIGGSD
jgi:hypothetical protein